jgi:hypothetical protein
MKLAAISTKLMQRPLAGRRLANMGAMRRIAVATTILLLLTAAAGAWQDYPRAEARSCLVEVLYSEELPIGPLFHHTVKAAVLVTPPGAPPFETTVLKVIPWQVPPPRRGQRVRVPCDSAPVNSSFGLF